MQEAGCRFRWRFLVGSVMLVALNVAAQDSSRQGQDQQSAGSQNSIADAARQSKAQIKRAKKIITDDDVEANAGPLPRLKLEGAENSQEIITAITKYKASHTADETEAVVRAWYEHYEQIAEAAIQENENVRSVQAANFSNGMDLCRNPQTYQQYEECQKRRMSDQRGARSDQVVVSKNPALQNRIQQALLSVRNGLNMAGLQYDWFKIRNQSGQEL